MSNKCSVWFCTDKAYAKGLCRAHYTNLGRYGMPITPHNKDTIRLIKDIAEHDEIYLDWHNDDIVRLYNSIKQYESRIQS